MAAAAGSSGVIILIDMDDTIEQLLRAWLRGVNERYGCSVRYEDITPGTCLHRIRDLPENRSMQYRTNRDSMTIC